MSNLIASLLAKGFRAAGARGEVYAQGILKRRKYLVYGGSVFCAGQLFQQFFYTWSVSSGPSMYPTLPSESHFIVISKQHGHGKNLQIGDIIMSSSPIFHNHHIGKRIIGMPGDYVVRDPHLAPSVGGAAVPGITDWRSERKIERGVELKERAEPEMIQVPEGHVWVAGDNMSWSRDSRFFGAVPMALIKGKTVARAEGPLSWTMLDQEGLRRVSKEDGH